MKIVHHWTAGKKLAAAVLALLLAIVLIDIYHDGKPAPSVPALSAEKRLELAQTLAYLDTGKKEPATELVNKYDLLLQELKAKCPKQDEHRISQLLNITKDRIDQAGIEITNLEVGQNMSAIIDPREPDCEHIATFYGDYVIKNRRK